MIGEFLLGNAARAMQRNSGKRYSSREEFLAALEQARKDNIAAGFSGEGFEDPDKWYFDAIEKYKGTDLYERLAANPHLFWNNEDFSPNLLQQFGEGLGDYQARMAYYEDLRNKANSYLTDQTNMISQQNYDSAAAQVAREKAAGINPDISGGQGISPGAAAENDQPAMPPTVSSSSSLAEISSMGVKFVSSVFSIAQGVYAMRGQGLQMVAQDIKNHQDAMGLLYDEVLNTLPASELSEEGIKNLDSAVLLRTVDAISKDSSFGSGTRKVLSRYAESLQGDGATAKMQTLRYELANRYLNQKKSTATALGDPYYSDSLVQWIENVSPYLEKVMDAAYKDAEVQIATNENELKYQQGYDPAAAAAAENEGNRLESTKAHNENLSESAYKELYDWLKNDDSPWSKFGLLILPEIRAFLRSWSGGSRRSSRHIDRSTHTTNAPQTVNKYGPTVINN